jgi:hypothetical protein
MAKKLNEEQVAKIKMHLIEGVPFKALAAMFGVSRGAIGDIAAGRRHPFVAAATPRKRRTRAVDVEEVSASDSDSDQLETAEPTTKTIIVTKPLTRPVLGIESGIDPEIRVRDLESEIVHLRKERDDARRAVKQNMTEHGLFKAVAAEMGPKIVPMDPLPGPVYPKLEKGAIEEHVVLVLSDGHHDQVVRPEECGGLELHNFGVSCRRAETLVDTVVDWTQGTLSPKFHFRTLNIFAIGDHTSGEIHNHVQRSAFRNIFKNCLAIGQLHALMFRDLAPYFERVNVLYLSGNHGRRTPKKDHHGAHDNFDYLVAETARLYCQEIENVSFTIPDAFSANVEIDGVGFGLSHGDDVRGSMGIPFYGLQRRQKGLIALNGLTGGPRIRYQVCGHHHCMASLADFDGELLVNGAWVATDAFAYNSFSGYRDPAQLLFGVKKSRGITWRLNVQLKTADDTKGPKRYRIAV